MRKDPLVSVELIRDYRTLSISNDFRSLVYVDFVRFCCESVFLVCAVAERHEGGSAAPAPGLDNLPVDYDQVGTVLS